MKLLSQLVKWWNGLFYDLTVPDGALKLLQAVDPDDARDWWYLPSGDDLPVEASIKNLDSPIRYQGGIGACTGFAMSAAMEITQRKRLDGYRLSPMFLYYKARELSGMECEDKGAYIRDVLKAAANDGAPLEEYWPYSNDNVFTPPSWVSSINARGFRIDKYERIKGSIITWGDLITSVKDAISHEKPVIAGIEIFSNYTEAKKTGLIPPKGNATSVGGHAICIVAYDDFEKVFTFKNSWGTGWGNAGYGYITYDYMRRYSEDVWAVTR